eukprot:Colp12_sorted_trinity150504_noHs@8537
MKMASVRFLSLCLCLAFVVAAAASPASDMVVGDTAAAFASVQDSLMTYCSTQEDASNCQFCMALMEFRNNFNHCLQKCYFVKRVSDVLQDASRDCNDACDENSDTSVCRVERNYFDLATSAPQRAESVEAQPPANAALVSGIVGAGVFMAVLVLVGSMSVYYLRRRARLQSQMTEESPLLRS